MKLQAMPTKKDGKGKDKPKRWRFVRLREQLAVQLDKLAERRVSDLTSETNRCVREALEREGLWPPPPEDST